MWRERLIVTSLVKNLSIKKKDVEEKFVDWTLKLNSNVGNLSTIMHPDDYQNWLTIKETFELNDTTDNYYYKRACAIVRGEPDPMNNNPNASQDE